MLRPLRSIVLAVVCGTLWAAAAPANAAVQVAGTGEPAYTKGTDNTYWFTYAAGLSSSDNYRLMLIYNRAGVSTAPQYTGALGGTASGTSWFNMTGIYSVPLSDGVSYGGCVSGQDFYSYLGAWTPSLGTSSCSDAGIRGLLTQSTIDRNAPQVAVSVNGTATFANAGPLNVAIQYADATSPPWPNSTNGLGANYVCVRTGGDPATVCNGQQFNYDPACSTLSAPRSQQTSFACQLTVDGSVPDGPVTLCARAADSAIPDNPSSANQLTKPGGGAVSSSDANLSAPACGYVYLDRTAPQLSIGGPATATVGELVSLTSGGSDALSGLSNTWTWNYGDNTPETTGSTGSHTYTQPGTYQIKLTSKDQAGNTGQATKTITVAAAPTGGTGGTTGGTGGTTGGTGGTTGGTGGTTAPPPATSNTAGGTVSTAPTAVQVTQAAGTTASTTKSAGALDVLGPKSVKLGKRKLALAITSDVPGKVQVTLIRSGRIRSKGSFTLKAAGTVGFSLKLPRGLTAGAYDLRIVLTPDGGGKPSTVKLKVAFVKGKTKAKAKAASVDRGAPIDRGPVLPAPGVDPQLARLP